jgi:hypothetical protein
MLLWVGLSGSMAAQITVHLSPSTDHAFDTYVRAAEAKMDWAPAVTVKPGDVTVMAGASDSLVPVPDGLIHDWKAATLVPGADTAKALAVFQDYGQYKKFFSPEVVDSKLLGHEGDHWRPWLRLKRTNVVTVVLDTEYEVEYRRLEGGRWAILSRSTKISELDDHGKPLAPGTGSGFLWRLNAYWLLEPRPDGLYLECRSISLSRDIPNGLGWLLRPMVSTLPRDSLRATMQEVRQALR